MSGEKRRLLQMDPKLSQTRRIMDVYDRDAFDSDHYTASWAA